MASTGDSPGFRAKKPKMKHSPSASPFYNAGVEEPKKHLCTGYGDEYDHDDSDDGILPTPSLTEDGSSLPVSAAAAAASSPSPPPAPAVVVPAKKRPCPDENDFLAEMEAQLGSSRVITPARRPLVFGRNAEPQQHPGSSILFHGAVVAAFIESLGSGVSNAKEITIDTSDIGIDVFGSPFLKTLAENARRGDYARAYAQTREYAQMWEYAQTREAARLRQARWKRGLWAKMDAFLLATAAAARGGVVVITPWRCKKARADDDARSKAELLPLREVGTLKAYVARLMAQDDDDTSEVTSDKMYNLWDYSFEAGRELHGAIRRLAAIKCVLVGGGAGPDEERVGDSELGAYLDIVSRGSSSSADQHQQQKQRRALLEAQIEDGDTDGILQAVADATRPYDVLYGAVVRLRNAAVAVHKELRRFRHEEVEQGGADARASD
ncbi:hypothetical protein B0T26DRAFT_170234 [Lasiosphaeria miniovina]|uniref:Uncharacterized protein n=1 Tax=Lasiosphaeria miniovina TaxID=1954250 RepID=A0AA40E4Z6_9PEZI|nr:uncharacterized protein B0T26DRAFT_170234 [Lasiosphaeria miniovina]KAK0728404.1 hypothetical protein B0T26DRAFT_170234 [Lasiosphaeria miniovina]